MKQENKTVRMQDMLFSVLNGWKRILLAVVILALVLGGFMGVRDASRLDPQAQAQARQKYEDALRQYNNARDTLDLSIRNLDAKLDEWKTYMEHSVLMNADYHNIYEAGANLYITTDYKVDPQLSLQNPDYTEAVVIQYTTALKSGAFDQTLAEQMGLDTRCLRELITFNRHGDSTISVVVRHSSREEATKLLGCILTYVRGLTADISETVCPHALRTTEPTVALTVSPEVETHQQKIRSEMTNDLNQLMDKWQKRDELQAPVSGEMTVSAVIRSAIRGAVIGGVLGGVLAVLWLLVAALLSDKVYSADALAARAEFPVLGSLDSGKKRGGAEKLLRKLEHRTGEAAAYIAARAANRCSESIALCGNVESAYIEEVQTLLGIHGIRVQASGDVLRDGDLVAALPGCSGALLVVRCGDTTYTQLTHMTQVIREAGKSILAAIVID